MKEFFNIMTKDVKQYGMFIALLVVMLFFTATTGGTFLTSRNLSNLFDQTGYVAVLAIGMTLILIIRQIDLSWVTPKISFLYKASLFFPG